MDVGVEAPLVDVAGAVDPPAQQPGGVAGERRRPHAASRWVTSRCTTSAHSYRSWTTSSVARTGSRPSASAQGPVGPPAPGEQLDDVGRAGGAPTAPQARRAALSPAPPSAPGCGCPSGPPGRG